MCYRLQVQQKTKTKNEQPFWAAFFASGNLIGGVLTTWYCTGRSHCFCSSQPLLSIPRFRSHAQFENGGPPKRDPRRVNMTSCTIIRSTATPSSNHRVDVERREEEATIGVWFRPCDIQLQLRYDMLDPCSSFHLTSLPTGLAGFNTGIPCLICAEYNSK